MKSVYFSNSKNQNQIIQYAAQTLRAASQLTTTGFSKLIPQASHYIGLKLLCNPFSKRDYEMKVDNRIHSQEIQDPDGKIQAYRFGEGKKTILLSHGWSDNSSTFTELIRFLVDLDYSVWSFDHIGHGKSEGSTAHLFAFINGLNSVIKHIEESGDEIEAIIGHSMGAVALMNLEKDFLDKKKTFFIATPVNFFDIMFQRINRAGFSDYFLHNLLGSVSKKYNGDWKRLRPYQQLTKLSDNSVFIHDEKDRYAPYHDIKVAQESVKFNLISTSGLGHARILKSKEMMQILREHLK